MSDKRQPRMVRQFVRALDNRFGQSTRKRMFRVAGISVVTLALLGNLAFLGVAAHEATTTSKPPPSPAVIAKRKALRKSLRAVAKKLAKAKAARAAAAAKPKAPVKPLTPAQLAAALKTMQQAGVKNLGLANTSAGTPAAPSNPSAVTKPGATPTPSNTGTGPSTTRQQKKAKRQAASNGF